MTKNESQKIEINFAFFGTPHFSVFTLEEMEKGGLLPSLVVTAPDRPAGRGLKLAPPPVKVWAKAHKIPVLQPEKLDSDFLYKLKTTNYKLSIVAAYGKIIPQAVLDIPAYGTLNVHPSLLPKFRGASPLQSTILSGDEETGVTIMQMDAEMDHGPIIKSQKLKVENMNTEELGEKLFRRGGQMLADIIPKWTAGEIKAMPQDHSAATYTKKVDKKDGLIDPDGDHELNWRKFRAYHPWPSIYFFTANGTRVKITAATFENGEFVIKRVVPEGKKETDYIYLK